MMTNKTIMLLIALVLFSFTTISLAFNSQCGAPGQGRGFGSGGGYGMARNLNLTAQQQQQFQTIMQEQRAAGQAWREQHHQATETKLSAVLNDEQLKQFKTFRQSRTNNRGWGLHQPKAYGRGMHY